MEESLFTDFSDKNDLKIYIIFAIMSVFAAAFAAIGSVVMFGINAFAIIYMAFAGVSVIFLIVGQATGKIKISTQIYTAIMMLAEFPIMYFNVREAAVPYFILGFYAASVLYVKPAKYVLLSLDGVAYTAAVTLQIIYPETYNSLLEAQGGYYIVLAFSLICIVVTAVILISTLNIIIHSFKTKNNEFLELNKRLERMNHYDALTPCYNRKFLMDYLSMNNNVRTNNGLSIVLFDVVDLAYVNFKYGYSVGDAMLSAFADIAFNDLHSHGFVARYDGQKFVAIIYVTIEEEVKRIIDGIMEDFANYGKKEKNDPFMVAYGYSVCKSNFSVDDELKIVYARCRENATKLPERNWKDIENSDTAAAMEVKEGETELSK